MVGVDRTPVSLLSPMKQKKYIAVGKDGRKQKKQVQVSILSWT